MSNDLNIAEALAAINGFKILNQQAPASLGIDAIFSVINPDQIRVPTEPIDAAEAYQQYSNPSLSSAERAIAGFHLIDNIIGVIFRPSPITIHRHCPLPTRRHPLRRDRVPPRPARPGQEIQRLRDRRRDPRPALRDEPLDHG